MTSKRNRPTLSAPLGPEGRKALAERVARINGKGDAARAKLAAKAGSKPGKANAARSVAGSVAAVEREITSAQKRSKQLDARGAYREADRVRDTLADLQRQLRRARVAESRAEARKARLDRFGLMVARSDTLTDWHADIADRWLAALDAAADGLMQRAADPEAMADETPPPAGARDPDTGLRMKPDVDGAAIFVRGRSVLDRWAKGVPVAAVKMGRRGKPETFDPKPVKRVRGQGAPSVQAVNLERRDRAHKLTEAFGQAVQDAGHPDWCRAVAIRVILHNEGQDATMQVLGVTPWTATRNQLHTAVAAGLSGVAKALGLPVEN